MAAAAAVLARTASVAAERGLPEVGAFVDALATDRDREVLLLAADGTDAGPLHRWISEQDPGTPVRTGRLEQSGPDPTTTLTMNRVVAALQCGMLLLPDAVEAAAAVIQRPPGSFAVVLVGAEVLRTEEELELVRRGIWRVLLGEPGVEWTGQDLAQHGCLLWSEHPVADVVADTVTRDTERLRHWVRASVPDDDALAPLRAEHAVDLLELGLARHASAEPARMSAPRRTVRELRTAAADLRGRLLRRLDADLAAMELQITASLQMLEQELLKGVEAHLERQEIAVLHGPALATAVSSYLAEGTRTWRSEAVQLAGTRLRRTAEQTDDMLDSVDWELVNAIVPPPSTGRYPTVILERIEPRTPVELPGLADPDLSGPDAPGRSGHPWLPTVRRAAFGGVCAVASLVILGPDLVPAVAAGAIGATGAAAIDARLTDSRARSSAAIWARAAIAATMGEFARSVRTGLREPTEPIRRAVAAAFAELDEALSSAGAQQAADGPDTPHHGRPETDAALLAGLRADLSAGADGRLSGRS